MSNALKMTMYGTASNGSVPPISDAELNLFLASLDCGRKRKELMRCALSLVGRVPYFWGGKSAPGWNEGVGTPPKLVTAAGSSSTGTIRPYGLDCSGFTEWVYQTALGVTLYDGFLEPVGCRMPFQKTNCCPATSASWRCPVQSQSTMYCSTRERMPTEPNYGSTVASGTGVVLNSPRPM